MAQIPVYPAIPYKAKPVVRKLFNCLVVNTNPGSAVSSTYANLDQGSADVQNGKYLLKTKYPLAGTVALQSSTPTQGCVFLNEAWIGMPPMHAWDQGQNNFEIPADGPPWWAELKAAGYKRYGPGILLKYPGGLKAYFDRFIKPNIQLGIFRSFDLKAACGVNWRDCLNFNLSNPLVSTTTKSAIANFTGMIVWNTEGFFPYRNEHVLQPVVNADGSKSWVVGAYGEAFRLALEETTGRIYGKDLLHDEFKKIWDDLVLGPNGLVAMTVAYIKSICPKAKVTGYDWPLGTSYPAVAPTLGDNNKWGGRHELLMKEELSGELDVAFRHFDALTPSHGYLSTALVADGTLNYDKAKAQTYSDYLTWRVGTSIRTKALRARLGNIPAYPFIRLCCADENNPGRERALNTLEHSSICYLLDQANADGAFIWEGIGFQNIGPAGSTIEQQLKIVQTASKVFDTFYGTLARTPVVPALTKLPVVTQTKI